MISRLIAKFKGLWQTSDKLGQRAVRSSAIVIFEKVALKGLAFLRTVFIARLIAPADIGLFGLAMLASSVNGILFQPGLQQAVVQKQDDVQHHLSSVWTANLIVNVFLALLLFSVTAPISGWFFHDASVVPLARALALSILIIGFENVGIIMFQRELRYNRQFIYNIIGYTSQWTITVGVALYMHNAWALVWGTIIGRVIFVGLSYILHEFRPRFEFNIQLLKELFRYGKWVGVAGILTFLISQGDNLSVGRLLNPEALAFYLTAYSLGTLPATEIVGVISGILFPLYANLQNDLARLKRAFIRISRLAFSISVPASFGLAVLANETVRFVYGSRWLPMVPILYVILIYGLFKAFELITEPLFRGIGRPHISTGVMALQAAVMFSVMVPLVHMFGALGAGLAALAGFLVAQAIFMHQLRKAISIGYSSLIRSALLPVIASILMSGIMLLSKTAIPIDTKTLLLSYIFAGAVVYFIVLYVLDHIFGSQWWESVQWVRKNL